MSKVGSSRHKSKEEKSKGVEQGEERRNRVRVVKKQVDDKVEAKRSGWMQRRFRGG